MDQAITHNYLINKYTNSTIKSNTLNNNTNNFKILIPEVNVLINSGKKILLFLYEIAAIMLLKFIGVTLYYLFTCLQEYKICMNLSYFEFLDCIPYFFIMLYGDLVFHMTL